MQATGPNNAQPIGPGGQRPCGGRIRPRLPYHERTSAAPGVLRRIRGQLDLGSLRSRGPTGEHRLVPLGLVVAGVLWAGVAPTASLTSREMLRDGLHRRRVRPGPHHLRQPAGRGPGHRGVGRPGRPGRARPAPGEARPRAVRGGRGPGRGGAGGGPGQRRAVAGPGPFADRPARGAYYRRKNAQETLRRQIATCAPRSPRSRPAQSSRWLAEVEQRRIDNLVKRGIGYRNRARPAEQHPEGRQRAGEGGLGRRSRRPAPSSACRPITRSAEYPQGAGEPAVDRPVGGQRDRLEPGRGRYPLRPEGRGPGQGIRGLPPPRGRQVGRRGSGEGHRAGPGGQSVARRRRPRPEAAR